MYAENRAASGNGIYALAKGTGAAIRAVGGSGGGIGLTAAAGTAAGSAIEITQGYLKFGSDNVSPTTALAANTYSTSNIPKGHGRLTSGATPAIVDGINVASVAVVDTNNIRVTFATAMASANYAPNVIGIGAGAVSWDVAATATTHFDIACYDMAGAVVNLGTTTKTIAWTIEGKQ
jgi:hypothetical protein